MKKAATFMKVSFFQFKEDYSKIFGDSNIKNIDIAYDNINIPKRATLGSAGYDFISPFTFSLKPHEIIKIPSGIRVQMKPGWVLQLYPRSSLGFKYQMMLGNTVGIIDSDYFNSPNEGHIIIQIVNSNPTETLDIKAGQAFIQGLFLEYGITTDDNAVDIRQGGFGSTNKNYNKISNN